MNSPVIVWFRLDLRTHDHPALSAAVASGRPVLPLYIYDPAEGVGAASRWWLHHSLTSLQASLPLVIRTGDAGTVLHDVIRETGAGAVYWNRAYDPASVARDTALKDALKHGGIDAQSFKGTVLFEPWEVTTQSGTPFRVFTPFYKACLARAATIGAALPAPADVTYAKADGLSVAALDLLPRLDWDAGFAPVWQAGETGAHARLHDFIDGSMAGYAAQRDFPAIEGTSRLSPHLHFGEISHRAVWHLAEPHTGSAAFLRELIWREFAIHLLYYNPRMRDEPLQPAFARFAWEPDAALQTAWTRGRTGYPIVDAGMRQLWQTGWMHNRVRMIVGSFLVKHLLQPWQAGERWFWDTLVDADAANNAAGWQWIAGCGADAAPYFRVFNPILQGQKFDPDGAYIRAFVPELRAVPTAHIHTPWTWGGAATLDYPAPVIAHEAGRARALAAYQKLKNNDDA